MSAYKWDSYYLSIAEAVANNSKCMSRKIGAVLVRDKSILTTGYNGPARGIPHCSERYVIDKYLQSYLKRAKKDFTSPMDVCPRRALNIPSGHGMDLCPASHAEVNCINNAARMGICTKDSTLYLSCEILPCKNCLSEIINAGISEVVVKKLEPYHENSLFLLENTKIILREYNLIS